MNRQYWEDFEKVLSIRVSTYCRDHCCTREQLKKVIEEIKLDLISELKERGLTPEDL